MLGPDCFEKMSILDLPFDLVRVGTIGDGSCFFHAIMYSMNDAYRKMTEQERSQFIREERKKLAERCDWVTFSLLGNSELMKLWFIVELREFIQINKDFSHFQMFTWKEWDDVIIPKLTVDWKTAGMTDFVDLLADTTRIQRTEAIAIVNNICITCIQRFKHHIEYGWVDHHLIEYIQSVYKINIDVYDYENKRLYSRFRCKEYTITILVLWIHEGHYETLGIMKDNQLVFAHTS